MIQRRSPDRQRTDQRNCQRGTRNHLIPHRVHHPGKKSHQRPESLFNIRDTAPGTMDEASNFDVAGQHQRHGNPANEIGHNRSRSQDGGYKRRDNKDSSSHRDIHCGSAQSPRPNHALQLLVCVGHRVVTTARGFSLAS